MPALLPEFRARVPGAVALRRLPNATCEDIRASGLARIFQPMRYGGSEAPLEAMIDILIPVGSACSANAWCLAQFLIHNYMIARWPTAAQDAIWGDQPDALVSGILIPLLGKAKRVDGGARLTGRWPFVSGIVGADWCILSGMMENATDAATIESYFLVPTSQVSIFDNWYSIGLQGTGSNDVEVTDSFIPAHMIITAKGFVRRRFCRSVRQSRSVIPSARLHDLRHSVDIDRDRPNAMVAEYLAQSRKAFTVMSGQEIRSFQTQQIKLGEATAALNAAQALIRADAREIQTLATTYQSPDSVKRSKYRSNAAHASALAYWAAQRIFDLAGARAIYTNNEIGVEFFSTSSSRRAT